MDQRWDVKLRVLDGPMSGVGEVVLRGPVVEVGTSPKPGGLALSGYRGLDRRHCVITAYDGGAVSVAPVGPNQVRTAPHPNVDWGAIEPMGGPAYLSEGTALHLGPPGRGATVQYLGARPLGEWGEGALTSSGPAPSTVVPASRVPLWFVGCTFLMVVGVVAVVGAAMIVVFQTQPEPLPPKVEGEALYEFASRDQVPPALVEGIDQGFHDFVVQVDAERAGEQRIAQPESWDPVFHDLVAASVGQHLSSWSVYRRLDQVRRHYAFVVGELRRAGLPEVFAAIPYQESLYTPDAQSEACAKGWWQLMPELAHRVEAEGLDMRVADCRFRDAPGLLWSPTHRTPPPVRDRDYLAQGRCRIPTQDGCAVDERTDLELSTAASIHTLSEAWDDPVLRDSGASVVITILSHNAGYDDSRYGVSRSTNLLPAFRSWSADHDRGDWHRFYGDNVRCDRPDPPEGGRCGSVLPAETQHYGYRIVATHLVAVCYYGLNYGTEPAFSPWVRYTRGDGYCTGLEIPTAEQVRRH